jgi:hypothetical protein
MTVFGHGSIHPHRAGANFHPGFPAEIHAATSRSKLPLAAHLRLRDAGLGRNGTGVRSVGRPRLGQNNPPRTGAPHRALDDRAARRRKMTVWSVDTCVVLDVLEHDPAFGRPSAELLQKLLPQGLAVSPVTLVELSAALGGDLAEQKRFLDLAGIAYIEPWTATDTELAHTAWHASVLAQRLGKAAQKPVAISSSVHLPPIARAWSHATRAISAAGSRP